MPFWTYPYIFILMLMTAASTAVKRRLGFALWWVVLDTTCMVVLLWLLVAYYRPEALGELSGAAPLLFGGALLWLGLSTHRELRVVEQLPLLRSEQSSAAQWISLLVGVLVLTPALGLGAIAVVRAWQG